MQTEFQYINRGDIFRLNGDTVELIGYNDGGLLVRHTRANKPKTWTIKPELSDKVYLLN